MFLKPQLCLSDIQSIMETNVLKMMRPISLNADGIDLTSPALITHPTNLLIISNILPS